MWRLCFKEKKLRSTKKHFSHESPGVPISDAMKRPETSLHSLNVVVDTATESLNEWFQILAEERGKFGVLLNFKKDNEALSSQCNATAMQLIS